MPTRVPRLPALLAALLAAVLPTATCAAQVTCTGVPGCTVSISAALSKAYVAKLVLSSATTTLAAPGASSFGAPAGVNTPAAVTLAVKSNAAHTITVAAAAPTFSGGSGIKPASSLRYSTDGFATLKGVSGTGSSLVTAAAPTAGTTHTIGYNTTYAFVQDTPGTYSLAVTYTLTAP
ncbi:MAG: hypothetical protein IT355_14795 [Gemmatimonadaceae bacterium]|nr:hypothetical protein [Gemmatimonadaceae bacterium]